MQLLRCLQTKIRLQNKLSMGRKPAIDQEQMGPKQGFMR
jgi:hypothetical protein